MKNPGRFLITVAAIFTAICVWLGIEERVVGAMCGSFIAAASAYTALDLRSVIRGTLIKAPGQYEVADLPKYYYTLALMTALFICCLLRQILFSDEMNLALGIIGPGIIAVLAIIISGLKINKFNTPLNKHKNPRKKEVRHESISNN